MESLLDEGSVGELMAALQQSASQPDSHQAAVRTLAEFFAGHFPVLCEVIAETVRASGHRRLHYWCDVAEMGELANYHFNLE